MSKEYFNQDVMSGSLLGCLEDLTHFYHRRMPAEALISGLPTKDGTLTCELFQRAAKRARFLSKIFSLNFGDINPGLLPCIVCFNENQFGVLTQLEADQATVRFNGKPQQMTREQLEAVYAGQVILVKPDQPYDQDDVDTTPFNLKNIKWFWKTVKSSWSSYLEVLFASLFINLFALALPLFVMNVYDRVVPNTAIETLWALAIGVFIIFVFDFLLKLLRIRFIDTAAHRIDCQLSANIFEHIMGVRMNKRPRGVGEIINAIQGFESFRDFMTSFSLAALIDFPFIILFIAIIGVIGGRLFIVPLILTPVVLIISFLIQAPLVKVIKNNYKLSSAKQQMLIESLVGIVGIKAQNAEATTQYKWEQLTTHASELTMRLKFLTALAMNFSTFSLYFGSIVVVIVGVYMIADNVLTVGALIACTMLTGRALAPISQIVNLILRYYQSKNSIKGVDDIMQLPVEQPADKKFFSPEKLAASIGFKDVSFRYQQARADAISKISFEIEPGMHVGIIGKVGAGKTTLLKLAIGLFEADQGKVLLGGHDIQTLNLPFVRKHIGYVQQEATLFSGSIRDNIVLGDPNISDDAVLSAIQSSGLASFISEHVEGINFQVGERGENLSSGQRQAVTIAQALLKDPILLVFDEPTASMDELSERGFRQRIKELYQDKTLLLSTHKASMLELVDHLIVLDGGQIVAKGPKDAVLKALQEKKIASLKDNKNESNDRG